MDQITSYPSAAEHGGDLPPELGRRRQQKLLSPVRLPDGRIAWLVTRYDDVKAVLADARFTRDQPAGAAEGGGAASRSVNTDGLAHARLRAAAARTFAGRQVGTMGPRIRAVTEHLADELERAGPPADLVSHVAAPLPAIVICELLGLPVADVPLFRHWCDSITVTGQDRDQSAWAELGTYLDRAIRAKRAAVEGGRPAAQDLLSQLIAAPGDEQRLDHAELIAVALLVLAGGLETTQTAISAGLLRLLERPGQLKRLRDDPGLLGPAVDEILRYQPVVDLNRVQMATEDVWLGQHLVRTGEFVQISVNAANRDERVFTDAGSLDIARQPNPHLAFGHGAHHCLGAALARMELRTVLATLIRRFPGLALATPAEELRWRGGHVTLGLDELPVSW